jgi:ribonucleoside-diphosphate reductase alpha chain
LPEHFPGPSRVRLPDDRNSITHRFEISNFVGYITVGLYEDGSPGELFVRMSKEGSTLSGLLDGWAITTSIALQYGVPLKAIVDKMSHMRFEPSGHSIHPAIGHAKSILDYVGRWLAWKFLSPEQRASLPPDPEEQLGA